VNREQRYRFFNRAAVVLGAIALLVFGTEAAIAVSRNQLVVGFNYWNAPLFSITQLIVAIVIAPFLLRYALKHWNDTKPPVPKDD
jgi:hypothetical protein